MKRTIITEIDTKGVAVFQIGNDYLVKNDNPESLHLYNNQITKIENLNENLKELYLKNNPVKEITKESYDLIKRNKISVIGIDIDKLKIVEEKK